MQLPFAKTRALEAQVDEFLNIIVKGVLAMKKSVEYYLVGDLDDFAARIEAVRDLENQADDLRKHTETMLYTYSLIPESRGDVLGLLENMDNVIDRAKEVLQSFDVQRPQIPEDYHQLFIELTENCIQAVDNVVGAARAFFRDTTVVRDFINKVDFYESEADRVGFKLKKQIFASELDMGHKLHLRYFAEQIESISDIAEDVGERLAIATIKRSI